MANEKKKQPKKLSVKKLEERIAPSMVGGGIIDPGTIENMTVDPTHATDGCAANYQSTTMDQISPSQPHEIADAPYQNPQPAGVNPDASHDPSGQYSDSHDNLDQQANTQDLNQPSGADQSYVEEAPTWKEPDWVTANADGSVNIVPPEGVGIQNGVATFPVDVANAALPLPTGVEIQGDGSVAVALPEGSQYNAEANTVTLEADSPLLKAVPENITTFENPDGTYCVALPPDGVSFNADTQTLTMSCDCVNELTPSNIEILDTGAVNITLPEGSEHNADGSIYMPPEATQFMDHPAPAYIENIDWATAQPDGEIVCDMPQGAVIEGGVATFSHDVVGDTLPIPEDITINSDGSMEVKLPEGTIYNADANTLKFEAGDIKADEIPNGVAFQLNDDGSILAKLPDGMEYNADTGAVHMDNYWANQIAPDTAAINMDGSISVDLPDQTQFDPDGAHFVIPAEHADFIDTPAPDYVHDVDWSTANGDGSYTVTPPNEFRVDLNQGQIDIPHDQIDQYVPLPNDMTILPDGSMDIKVPEGTVFNADLGRLTFPEGSVHLNEIPEGITAELNASGQVAVTLPDGMQYSPEAGAVHMDNYWANQVAPNAVEVTPDGSLRVDLPADCEFHDNGSFTVPEHSADFIAHPMPPYIAEGPDWVSPNPDGSVTLEAPRDVHVSPENGTMNFSCDACNDHFKDYMPEDFRLNADGSAQIGVPEGSTFDAANNTLSFPPGAVHMNEIPEGIEAQLNADGSINVRLPEGMDYNANTGMVHMSNAWVNEFAPEPVQIQVDGQIKVELPQGTQYFDGGACTIPANSAGFLEPAPPVFGSMNEDMRKAA